jgi:hypothetical protein
MQAASLLRQDSLASYQTAFPSRIDSSFSPHVEGSITYISLSSHGTITHNTIHRYSHSHQRFVTMEDGDDEASFYEYYAERFLSYPKNLIGGHYRPKLIQGCFRYHSLYAHILFPRVRRDVTDYVEIIDYGSGRLSVCCRSRIIECSMCSVSNSNESFGRKGTNTDRR